MSLLGDLEVVLRRLVNHFPTRTRSEGHFTSKPLFLIIETFLNLKPYHLVQTSITCFNEDLYWNDMILYIKGEMLLAYMIFKVQPRRYNLN